jgi:hypothetical protein
MKKSLFSLKPVWVFVALLFSNLVSAQTNFSFVIDQPETPLLIDAGSDQVLSNGNTVTLGGSPTATGGFGNYTYLWDNDQLLNNPNIANPTVVQLNQSTTFTLTVFDSNNACVKQDQVLVDYVNSISAKNRESIQMFPNPFIDLVRITADKPITSIKIFNITGQLVWEESDIQEKNIEVETSRLNNGVYFFSITLLNNTLISNKLCKIFTGN